MLPAWKQSYLKSIIFEESPQSNFAMASYRAYDGNVSAYGTDQSKTVPAMLMRVGGGAKLMNRLSSMSNS